MGRSAWCGQPASPSEHEWSIEGVDTKWPDIGAKCRAYEGLPSPFTQCTGQIVAACGATALQANSGPGPEPHGPGSRPAIRAYGIARSIRSGAEGRDGLVPDHMAVEWNMDTTVAGPQSHEAPGQGDVELRCWLP